MKAYLNYFKLRIITNLQYRASAIAGILTQLFFAFAYLMMYLAFYSSNDTANVPMQWNQLVTYMWLQQAFFALTFPYVRETELFDMIKNGNLAYELIRPQNFYLKFYIKMIAKSMVSALLRFWPIIIIGLLLPYPYKLALPSSFGNFLLFVISLLLSSLLVTAMSLIIHLITMFTFDSRGISSTYTTIANVFAGSIIPIPFFPSWLIVISNYLPFRYIGDFPFRVYSGSIGISQGLNLLLGSFGWLVAMVIIGLLLAKYSLKKSVIQGG